MKKIMACIWVLIISVQLLAQNRVITGRVTDAQGRPVSYATVTVKGTKTSVSADENGNFSIQAAPNSILVFSASGYTASETNIGDRTSVNGTLANAAALQEVVVTALGQTRAKDKVGYATSSFRSDDVNRSAPVSPLDGLQGRVAGAEISTVGGQPGSSTKIILRGYSSFSTSGGSENQALIVVDGVPFNNSRLGSFNDFLNSGGADFGNGLNDLNPGDIENITILKGAAATSLYGSRASNGVVLVTTKRGRAGRITIDVNSSSVFSTVAKLPDFQNTWGQGWSGQHLKEENGSWGPKLDGKDRLWGSQVDNSRLIKPFVAVEDNVRNFYDLGKEFNNSIALRGGNETANFYLSYGNVHNDGVLPGKTDVYNRNTVALRGQLKANRFSAAASLNYINKEGHTAFSNSQDAAGSSTFSNIIQIPRDIYITDFKDYNNKFFNVDNYFTPYASNPYFSLFENGNNQQNDRVFGNIELGYDFSKVFNVRWRTGADVADARVKDWQAIENPKPNSWRGPNPTNYEGASLTPLIGGVRELSQYVRELNSDFFLNYNKDVVPDLNVSGFLGFNYNERESRTHQSRITGLTIPGYYDITNAGSPPVDAAVTSKRRLIGAFGQLNLAYKDYLFISGSARNDWSSTLPIGKNSYFYPGVNASLLLSRLLDLDNTGISYFKLRGAYGKTGKDAPVYSLRSIGVSSGVGLAFGNITLPLNNVSSFELGNTIGNSNLKPELTTEYEVGTELRFLKDRIGLDFTYYRKRTKGQILSVPIAASTGYQSLVANFGLVQNKGIEFVGTLVPARSKNFNWTTTVTFTQNRNKVLELPEGLDKVDFNSSYNISFVARVGYPIGIFEAPKKLMTEDGKYVVNPAGYFAQTPEDEVYGNIERDYNLGLNNSISYKNWNLGFNLDYRKGGIFYSYTAHLTYFVGNAWLTQYNDRRPFIIPNSVVQTGTDAQGKPVYAENTTPIDVNKINAYWYNSSNAPHSYELVLLPKDFLKLRDITLTYRFPSSVAQKIRAQNISISVIGRNFLLWVPKKNTFIDPEISNLGNDLVGELGEEGGSPTFKAYGAALRITF
jgi:TonB-linked SusC/RagA family outer membrane protein